jgi:hypothetical protein
MANGNGISDLEEGTPDPAAPVPIEVDVKPQPAATAAAAPAGAQFVSPSQLQAALRGKSPAELAEIERQAAEGFASLKNMLDAARSEASGSPPPIEIGAAQTPSSAAAPAQPPAPAAATKPAQPARNIDKWRQRAQPMAKLRPLYYHWTIEAMEAGSYNFEEVPGSGKLEKRYRPLNGLILRRFNEPGDGGSPAVIFMTYTKMMAEDCAGNISEIEDGLHVLMHLNHHARELLPILAEAISRSGRPHVIVTPMGYRHLADGSQEMTFELEVQPDPDDPRKTKLITELSAVGAKNKEASLEAAAR